MLTGARAAAGVAGPKPGPAPAYRFPTRPAPSPAPPRAPAGTTSGVNFAEPGMRNSIHWL